MKTNPVTGQRYHSTEVCAARVATAILDVLIGKRTRYIGNGTPGSVTRELFRDLFPDEEFKVGSYHSHLVVDGLNYLEYHGLVYIERQSDPTHAPGIAKGHTGNKIIRLTVNT